MNKKRRIIKSIKYRHWQNFCIYALYEVSLAHN